MTGLPGPRPIVLVVEDEVVTRHAAVAMVADAGFAPLEAADGTEAVRILDSVGGVRVVMTDIDMPAGLDGVKLAACIHRRWPGIGIVVVSGKVQPPPGDVPPDARFFRKPYDEAAVAKVIREMASR